MAGFDDLLRSALGSQTTDAPAQSRGLVEGLLSRLQPSGGVDGLARMFEQKGLGAAAGSWIGTGQNQAVTPDQVTVCHGGSARSRANGPCGSGFAAASSPR